MARIKGTALLPLVKALRVNKAGARELVPLILQHYLEDRIIVFGWYPAEDFMGLLRAASALVPHSKEQFCEFMGRASARTDLNGVYKNFLRTGDPLASLKAGIQAWRSYHDTGRVLVTAEGENSARVDLLDYGMPCVEMCFMNSGWIDEEVCLAGARDTETMHTLCCCRGESVCRWELKWGSVAAG